MKQLAIVLLARVYSSTGPSWADATARRQSSRRGRRTRALRPDGARSRLEASRRITIGVAASTDDRLDPNPGTTGAVQTPIRRVGSRATVLAQAVLGQEADGPWTMPLRQRPRVRVRQRASAACRWPCRTPATVVPTDRNGRRGERGLWSESVTSTCHATCRHAISSTRMSEASKLGDILREHDVLGADPDRVQHLRGTRQRGPVRRSIATTAARSFGELPPVAAGRGERFRCCRRSPDDRRVAVHDRSRPRVDPATGGPESRRMAPDRYAACIVSVDSARASAPQLFTRIGIEGDERLAVRTSQDRAGLRTDRTPTPRQRRHRSPRGRREVPRRSVAVRRPLRRARCLVDGDEHCDSPRTALRAGRRRAALTDPAQATAGYTHGQANAQSS